MVRLTLWFLRWLLLAPLVFYSVAWVRISLHDFQNATVGLRVFTSAFFGSLIAGLVFRILATRWRKSDPIEFIDTLEHELTHAIIGLLTFAPPVSLHATLRQGGEVELKRNNPLAALAPYFLPLYALVVALIVHWLQPGPQYFGRLLVGFLLGSFFYRLKHEFHLGQTDFKVYGWIFSFLLIAALLPLALGGVLQASGHYQAHWIDKVIPTLLSQFQWFSSLLISFWHQFR